MQAEAEPNSAAPRTRPRLLWFGVAIFAAFLVVVVVGGVYAYHAYVPKTPSVASGTPASGAASSSTLSTNDRNVINSSQSLGARASQLGAELGKAAITGNKAKINEHALEMKKIGTQLQALAATAQDARLNNGLRKSGDGAVMTADGILQGSASMTDQGLKLIKESGEQLNALQ